MGAGESGKYQIAGIRRSFRYLHAGQHFVGFPCLHDMGEIQSRIDTVADHVKRYGNNVHITGSFTVSEQSTFHTVGAG